MQDGPALLARYKPSLRVFGLRCLIVGGATLILVLIVLILFSVGLNLFLSEWLYWLLFAVVLTMTMVVFDEFIKWRRVKSDQWDLTPSQLLYANADQNEESALNLSDITDVRLRFFWSVILRLSDGTAVTMSYLPNARQAQGDITQAKEAMR